MVYANNPLSLDHDARIRIPYLRELWPSWRNARGDTASLYDALTGLCGGCGVAGVQSRPTRKRKTLLWGEGHVWGPGQNIPAKPATPQTRGEAVSLTARESKALHILAYVSRLHRQ